MINFTGGERERGEGGGEEGGGEREGVAMGDEGVGSKRK
jgi:hypothetical protein